MGTDPQLRCIMLNICLLKTSPGDLGLRPESQPTHFAPVDKIGSKDCPHLSKLPKIANQVLSYHKIFLAIHDVILLGW